jgi:micrococcal nuclease
VLKFGLCALALLLFFAAPAAAQDTQTVTVQRVVDGDTVEVRPQVEGTEDVRLLGVDTPETVDPNEDVEPFGPQASSFTKERLEGKRVTLAFDEERVDSFGRALAFVRLSRAGDATFNEELLRGGYAQLYVVPPNDLYEARLRRAQAEARQAERGIWGLTKAQQCQLADRGNGIGEGTPGCDRPGGNPPRNPPVDPPNGNPGPSNRPPTLPPTGGPAFSMIALSGGALLALALTAAGGFFVTRHARR